MRQKKKKSKHADSVGGKKKYVNEGRQKYDRDQHGRYKNKFAEGMSYLHFLMHELRPKHEDSAEALITQ